MRNIVLTDGFLEAAYELPKDAARKMIKALHLFTKDKRHPGLHLEALAGAAERRLSIRVDDNLRIILEDGNPPVLIYVGPHDEAYRAARRLEMLPELCELTPRAESAPEESERVVRPPEMFGGHSRRKLPFDLPVPLSEDRLDPFLLHTRKYFPLTRYLIRVRQATLSLTFTQIEKLVAKRLPDSARKHAASWWANDATHTQALAWLVAGYRSMNLKLKEERIGFQKR